MAYVSDIDFVVGGERDQCPDGRDSVQKTDLSERADLNQGASGKYVYMCNRRTDTSGYADIKFAVNSCPPGYTRIDKDVNDGADGKYVYACVKPMATGTDYGITDVRFSVADNEKDAKKCPPGWEGEFGQDLNDGSGGQWIYLCKKRGRGPKVTNPGGGLGLSSSTLLWVGGGVCVVCLSAVCAIVLVLVLKKKK